MDWSQEKCLLMIEAYQNARCLWEPTFEYYKNTNRKQDAWQEIANLLECSVNEAKKKMDSLLASYRRERQKSMCMKSGSGADSTYKSKWFAFASMHFLMDKYKPRKTFDFDTNQNKNRVVFSARGLMPPVFTPLNDDLTINYAAILPYAQYLQKS